MSDLGEEGFVVEEGLGVLVGEGLEEEELLWPTPVLPPEFLY